MIDLTEHFIVKQKSILKHQKLLLQDVTLGAWVKYRKIAWIAEITASQIVADHKGNAFSVEKIVKNGYAFYYYHCYVSILALPSIEIIDSLGSLSCR